MSKVVSIRKVDLEAVHCAGYGHSWTILEQGKRKHGPFAGMPVLVLWCSVCGSEREDVLSWSGELVTRTYNSDESYILNARMLCEEYGGRRAAYRLAKVKEIRKSKHVLEDVG